MSGGGERARVRVGRAGSRRRRAGSRLNSHQKNINQPWTTTGREEASDRHQNVMRAAAAASIAPASASPSARRTRARARTRADASASASASASRGDHRETRLGAGVAENDDVGGKSLRNGVHIANGVVWEAVSAVSPLGFDARSIVVVADDAPPSLRVPLTRRAALAAASLAPLAAASPPTSLATTEMVYDGAPVTAFAFNVTLDVVSIRGTAPGEWCDQFNRTMSGKGKASLSTATTPQDVYDGLVAVTPPRPMVAAPGGGPGGLAPTPPPPKKKGKGGSSAKARSVLSHTSPHTTASAW